MRDYDLLVIGELNADILVMPDATPVFGQFEKLVPGIRVTGGGSAAITAAAAARLGLRVLYASVVGDDPFGHMLLDLMRAAGVDVAHVRVDPAVATGATVHLLRPDGDRAMLTHLGSIAAIDAGLLPEGWCDRASHWHLASPFLLGRLYPDMPALAVTAKRHGMTVSLDTNWDPRGAWDLRALLEHVDILLPNEAELQAITGVQGVGPAAEAALERVAVLAVKQGAAGAVGAQGQERVHVPAFDVPVVDTIGAGDTFDAGFLAAWLRGATLSQAVAMGSACAALGATAWGGFDGQPDWASALALVGAQAPAHHAGLAALAH
jgi:sugar/nucleoside kinase (ribokinase family)